MALSCPFSEESSSASSFHASLLQAIVPATRVSSFTTLQIFQEAVLSQAWRQTNPKTPLTVICCLSCFSCYFSAKLESKTNLKTLLSSAVCHVSVITSVLSQARRQDQPEDARAQLSPAGVLRPRRNKASRWTLLALLRQMGMWFLSSSFMTSLNTHCITPISLLVIVMPTFFQMLDTPTHHNQEQIAACITFFTV